MLRAIGTVRYRTVRYQVPVLYRTVPVPYRTFSHFRYGTGTVPVRYRTLRYGTCTRPYRVVRYRMEPYLCTVLYRTVPYNTVPYRTALHGTVPYRNKPYRNNTVLEIRGVPGSVVWTLYIVPPCPNRSRFAAFQDF